jgi:protocatechuate 3,4-dioxygenase beta subunit
MIALLLLGIALLQGADPQGAAEATAQIRGRITDALSGQPLPGARVMLSDSTNKINRMVVADETGAFRIADLPVGRYSGFADPGANRGTHVMAALGADADTRMFDLRKGETRVINVVLPRAYAIGAHVVDEDGVPLAGMRIGVQSSTGVGGGPFPVRQTTDDRGRVRLYGLSPGRYIVCAEPNTSLAAARRATAEGLLRTCHPSATDESLAEIVPVERSDVENIEIRVRRGRTATISGRVLDATGAPASIARLGLSRSIAGGSSSSSIFVKPDGAFMAANVPPGEYALEAWLGGPDAPEHRRPLENAWVPIRIDGADLDNVTIQLRRANDISGRVVLEDPTVVLPTPQGSSLIIGHRLVEDRSESGRSRRYAHVRDDRTFTIEGVTGTRYLSFANVPQGWYVKSVRYGGKDVLDVPIDMDDSRIRGSMEVLLSNRGAVLTGRALDDRGNPLPRAQVWLVRVRGDAPLEDRVNVTRATPAGTFQFGPVRGGEYAVLAIAPTPRRVLPAEARALVEAADRVVLGELDERSIDVHATRIQDR